jgi:hypothetical protein
VNQDLAAAEYRCPGETCQISRSVHLARLASFHPACRRCPRRNDTVGLSRRRIRQLAEVDSRAHQPLPFQAEGVGNVAINDLSPKVARWIAIEFARRITCPAVVVASDGRLATAAIIAAIVEGVRWTGCQVIDIGPASAPCAARAIQHLAAGGGIFVGNAGGAPHTVGLKFWSRAEPLSQGGLLDAMATSLRLGAGEAMIDRPARAFGTLRRFAAADFYLDDLRPAYHALRPLCFVLDCAVGPVVAYLNALVRNVACRIITGKSSRLGEQVVERRVGAARKSAVDGALREPIQNDDGLLQGFDSVRNPPLSQRFASRTLQDCGKCGLGEQVVAAGAHFGMRIGDDGENGQVVDERGQSVATERLLALIAASFAGPAVRGEKLRQQTFLRMQESGAAIAADAAGRLWYADNHAPLPDALRTLTHLLVLLSRNDLELSAVLDGGGMRDER